MTQFLFNNQNLLSAYPFFLKNLDIGQAMNEIHTSIFHFFTGVVNIGCDLSSFECVLLQENAHFSISEALIAAIEQV